MCAYPFDDLRRILALESERQRCASSARISAPCPPGFSETLQEAACSPIACCCSSATADGRFLPPRAYPAPGSAAVSTHDIATLRRLLARPRPRLAARSRPLSRARPRPRRERAGAPASTAAGCSTRCVAERVITLPRARWRAAAARRWRRPSSRSSPRPSIGFSAAAPSALVLMQIEDALGEIEQANLPGTIERASELARQALAAARGRSSPPDDFEPSRRRPRHRAAGRRDRAAARDLSAAAQPQLHLRAMRRALVDYLADLGRQPSLYLALPQGAAGLDAWLRHHRSRRAQSRDRQRGGSRVASAIDCSGAAWGSCSISCRTTWASAAGQCLVARRARMGRGLALCRLSSTSIGARRAPRSRRQGAAAGAGRPVRRDPRERRDRACASTPAEGSFSAWYYEHRFPITPLRYGAAAARRRGAGGRGRGAEAACRRLRPTARDAGARAAARRASMPRACGSKRRSRRWPDAMPAAAAALERAAASAVNGEPGEAGSWRRLHALLEAQSYRVAYWRVAADEINYRRFFNINDLAGIRIELPELFDARPSPGADAGRRGAAAGPAHRPYRRALRSRALIAAPAARGRRGRGRAGRRLLHRCREDPGAVRGAAQLAGRRHHRL